MNYDPGQDFSWDNVHLGFADAVRQSGIPRLEAETTWLDGSSWLRYGLTESIRTDAVLRRFDDSGHVKAVWDVKTGQATLGRARVQSIRDHVGGDGSVPIIELNGVRGVMIKALAHGVGRSGMDLSDLVIVTQRPIAEIEWQASIDRAGFAVPLRLTSPMSASGEVSATLGGQPVTLRFEPVDLASLPRPPAGAFRQAFAISGRGALRDSAARFAAALAYAAAAGGRGYLPATGTVVSLDPLRELVDGMLAVIAEPGRVDPPPSPGEPSGPMVIQVRPAR